MRSLRARKAESAQKDARRGRRKGDEGDADTGSNAQEQIAQSKRTRNRVETRSLAAASAVKKDVDAKERSSRSSLVSVAEAMTRRPEEVKKRGGCHDVFAGGVRDIRRALERARRSQSAVFQRDIVESRSVSGDVRAARVIAADGVPTDVEPRFALSSARPTSPSWRCWLTMCTSTRRRSQSVQHRMAIVKKMFYQHR